MELCRIDAEVPLPSCSQPTCRTPSVVLARPTRRMFRSGLPTPVTWVHLPGRAGLGSAGRGERGDAGDRGECDRTESHSAPLSGCEAARSLTRALQSGAFRLDAVPVEVRGREADQRT